MSSFAVDAMWTGAVTDLDAEEANRAFVLAKSAASSVVWPFLAQAETEDEFTQRLAYCLPQLEAAVEVNWLGPVQASLHEDWTDLNAYRVKTAQVEGVEGRYVHAALDDTGNGTYTVAFLNRQGIETPVQIAATGMARDEAERHVRDIARLIGVAAYVDGREVWDGRLRPGELYFHAGAQKWVKYAAGDSPFTDEQFQQEYEQFKRSPTWELGNVHKALNMLPALNGPQELARLEAVKQIFKERRGKTSAKGGMTFHESYGEVSRPQLAAYRKHNVPPALHDELAGYFGSENHDAITNYVNQAGQRNGRIDYGDVYRHRPSASGHLRELEEGGGGWSYESKQATNYQPDPDMAWRYHYPQGSDPTVVNGAPGVNQTVGPQVDSDGFPTDLAQGEGRSVPKIEEQLTPQPWVVTPGTEWIERPMPQAAQFGYMPMGAQAGKQAASLACGHAECVRGLPCKREDPEYWARATGRTQAGLSQPYPGEGVEASPGQSPFFFDGGPEGVTGGGQPPGFPVDPDAEEPLDGTPLHQIYQQPGPPPDSQGSAQSQIDGQGYSRQGARYQHRYSPGYPHMVVHPIDEGLQPPLHDVYMHEGPDENFHVGMWPSRSVQAEAAQYGRHYARGHGLVNRGEPQSIPVHMITDPSPFAAKKPNITDLPPVGFGPTQAALQAIANQYIEKRGDQWVILQKGTGKVLSHHDSEEKANESFSAMMMNKHGEYTPWEDLQWSKWPSEVAEFNKPKDHQAHTTEIAPNLYKVHCSNCAYHELTHGEGNAEFLATHHERQSRTGSRLPLAEAATDGKIIGFCDNCGKAVRWHDGKGDTKQLVHLHNADNKCGSPALKEKKTAARGLSGMAHLEQAHFDVGGSHHTVHYHAQQAMGDDGQPAPGFTTGIYTVESPDYDTQHFRHSPYKPNSWAGQAKRYAADQVENLLLSRYRERVPNKLGLPPGQAARDDETNVWGTPKSQVGEGYCPECEHPEPGHYTNCPLNRSVPAPGSPNRSLYTSQAARDDPSTSSYYDGTGSYVTCPDCGEKAARPGQACPHCGSRATQRMAVIHTAGIECPECGKRWDSDDSGYAKREDHIRNEHPDKDYLHGRESVHKRGQTGKTAYTAQFVKEAPGSGEHAPYEIRKVDGGYAVFNAKGERKNSDPKSHEEARKFQKALYMNVPGASESAEKAASLGPQFFDPHLGNAADGMGAAMPNQPGMMPNPTDTPDLNAPVPDPLQPSQPAQANPQLPNSQGAMRDPKFKPGDRVTSFRGEPATVEQVYPSREEGKSHRVQVKWDNDTDPDWLDQTAYYEHVFHHHPDTEKDIGAQVNAAVPHAKEIERAYAAKQGAAITTPTLQNPTGRNPDEYAANTFEGPVKTRPMQGAEERNINTPVLPADPIHTLDTDVSGTRERQDEDADNTDAEPREASRKSITEIIMEAAA